MTTRNKRPSLSQQPPEHTEMLRKALEESLQRVLANCGEKKILHESHCFTGGPKGYFAISAVFVACPEEFAHDLRRRLNQTVESFFDEQGYKVEKPPVIQ